MNRYFQLPQGRKLACTQPAHFPELESKSRQLLQANAELLEFKQALAFSQQQLHVAQQQIARLSQTNAKLKRKTIRLTKKCTQALHFAHHDQLTGLPNRNLFLDRLKQAMAQSERQQTQVVLLFIDLDKFKQINDQYGHAAGDQLLQHVANRLSACIRVCDTACRYGGDEFLIMLPELNISESIAAVKEKIYNYLAATYVLNGQAITMSASIGVSVYKGGGKNCRDLIKQADMDMYVAKAQR